MVLDRESPASPDFQALAPMPFGPRENEPAAREFRKALRGVRVLPGEVYMDQRVRETGRDFRIFDVILFLTTVLAAIGVANQLAILVHARRRELLLYRTLGMTEGEVRMLVIGEGAFTGLVGGALGIARAVLAHLERRPRPSGGLWLWSPRPPLSCPPPFDRAISIRRYNIARSALRGVVFALPRPSKRMSSIS